ncbi:exonuclease domain-containing protein [Zhihengliuella salsuginis]|uniref:DNA polymerase III subunit epsilon n=1 Tax=Zhihengliuella salsuginis TaxID=578222 RepID=A0ABQ3GHW3_9MICC|nr:exonuclease domain-containing protein [Zhihengliuella salsuginis]GHD05105.1 DNA polymerase III subunit epsilon [Zhihengliuella salsuginis]
MHDLNFTAVDVETANSSYASICQVAAVQVRAGRIIGQHTWYVRPEAGVGEFTPRNTQIHGITGDMVVGAPGWRESMGRLAELAGEHPYVAFNTAFDKSAISQACGLSGVAAPANDFHCALVLARRLLQLPRHRLPDVAQHLGIGAFQHHDAGEDARVAAEIVLELARRERASHVSHLWPARPAPSAGASAASKYYGRAYTASSKELPAPSPTADPSHPFHGRHVVLTGDLESMGRWEAMEAIAANGGTNGKGVTKKTGVLVVGDGRRSVTAAELAAGSSKERKAHAYMAAGQEILLITEPDFLRLTR